jgi:hypothetical protein
MEGSNAVPEILDFSVNDSPNGLTEGWSIALDFRSRTRSGQSDVMAPEETA